MSQTPKIQGLSGATTGITPGGSQSAHVAVGDGDPNLAKSSQQHKSSSSSSKKDKKEVSLLSGLPYNTVLQKELLDKCDWQNRLIYAARMLLGGNSVNGFLRGTATAQRIKKQRARQVGITKKAAAAAAQAGSSSLTPEPVAVDAEKKEKKSSDHSEDEEQMKKDIMNPRTVKKLKCELEASLSFCAQLHNLARSIILDVDPRQRPFLPPLLHFEGDRPSTTLLPSASMAPPAARPFAPPAAAPAPISSEMSANLPVSSKMNTTTAGMQSGGQAKNTNEGNRNSMAMKTTVSPGNSEGSTLRKSRKKKLPPNTEPPPNVPEFDNAGRRLVSKAEHNVRVFEMLRFRALRQGDFVAARTTSRDLWILARVLKDYNTHEMPALEFLQLSETRRDALFREKVHVKDVEEKDGDNNAFQVPRNLVLPLPRTYAEAAEWGQRVKKGMRVYSMYPNTTSLYPATIIDSTTYCRGDDDIIVVEFDGEEPDETGSIPKYHIPARFVTLIPKEFPSSQPPVVNNKSSSNKRKSSSSATHTPERTKQQKKMTDDLMDFGDFDGNFDALDLDFDKPMAAEDDDDGGFPPLL